MFNTLEIVQRKAEAPRIARNPLVLKRRGRVWDVLFRNAEGEQRRVDTISGSRENAIAEAQRYLREIGCENVPIQCDDCRNPRRIQKRHTLVRH